MLMCLDRNDFLLEYRKRNREIQDVLYHTGCIVFGTDNFVRADL